MREILIDALKHRFDAYDEIVASLTDAALGMKIDVPRHKSMAEHLWCIVGARESYARAIEAGTWQGFGCSLSAYSHADFSERLRTSASEVLQVLDSVADWTVERDQLLLALGEHEVMHEGQIIRHMYALEMAIPDSVRWA